MSVDPPKSLWNSLEIAKLLASLLTPILVVALGFQINRSFRDADAARERAVQAAQRIQKEAEDARLQSQARQAAVSTFSRFIYERRARSELLASALKRHAESPTEDSKKEVLDRKRLYDDAYFNWNANHQANLLLVRQVLGSDSYSAFERMVESRLVGQTFSPLDDCLTRAYDASIRSKDPRQILKLCNASELIQRVLDCGYAITDELFQLSSPSGRSQEPSRIVADRCPNLVRFKNVDSDTVQVVLDVGSNPIPNNFTLHSGTVQFVKVGEADLLWCAYPIDSTPCRPNTIVHPGGHVDINVARARTQQTVSSQPTIGR